MLLDEYLNYLQLEQEIEEKFTLIQKLVRLAKDPLKKKEYLAALNAHKKQIKQMSKGKLKQSGEQLAKKRKTVKRRTIGTSAGGLSAVGAGGFYSAKRGDAKNK